MTSQADRQAVEQFLTAHQRRGYEGLSAQEHYDRIRQFGDSILTGHAAQDGEGCYFTIRNGLVASTRYPEDLFGADCFSDYVELRAAHAEALRRATCNDSLQVNEAAAARGGHD